MDYTEKTYAAMYCGPVEKLHGQYALIRYTDDPGTVLAQFNTNPLYLGGKNLAIGWHEFARTSFTKP